jgi:hypothetical protein
MNPGWLWLAHDHPLLLLSALQSRCMLCPNVLVRPWAGWNIESSQFRIADMTDSFGFHLLGQVHLEKPCVPRVGPEDSVGNVA